MTLSSLSSLYSDLLRLFFPARCPVCDRDLAGNEWICTDCREAIRRIRSDPGLRLLEGRPVIAACAYEHPLTELIPIAKSAVRPILFPLLADEIVIALTAAGLARYPEVIVPVPLHPARYRERGFNQAEVIARRLGKVCDRPVAARALKRIRHTPPQKQSDRETRLQVLENAFAPGPDADMVAGQRVLLIDDVVTTGATLTASWRALEPLRPAGVIGAAVARTVSTKTRY